MFQIFILYINLDIRIGFFGYFFGFSGFSGFRVTRSGSVNNTSGSDMFCNTLQDPLRYFLHFGSGTDRVFRFGFGSDFGFRILCPAQYDFLLSFVLIDYKNTFNPFPSFSATQSDSFVSRTFFPV